MAAVYFNNEFVFYWQGKPPERGHFFVWNDQVYVVAERKFKGNVFLLEIKKLWH
ncbi:MAG: hypothetical protein KGM16_17875 [Bacteroidota bacterium]|nr:hypothetical protein [Bacteroidota bacterium]